MEKKAVDENSDGGIFVYIQLERMNQTRSTHAPNK